MCHHLDTRKTLLELFVYDLITWHFNYAVNRV